MSLIRQFPLNTVLFESSWCLIGLWNCLPTDPLWNQENVIGCKPVIAIPWTSLVIDRASLRNEVVDPNSVVYYRAGEPYKRRLISPRGDLCVFINPSEELLNEALEEAQLPTPAEAFPFSAGPAVSNVTRAQHELSRSLIRRPAQNAIEIESALTEIVRTLVTAAGRHTHRPRALPSKATQRAHRELIQNTKSALAQFLEDPASTNRFGIEELARRVHASPYHLCRIFERDVGMTIGQYWMRLRLRTAAERLVWSDHTITSIAHDLGFSSHAHFTSSWSNEFGSPPSALRHA